MDLRDKVVVITGASMGIGEALARAFVQAGSIVVMTSRDLARVEAARQRVGMQSTLALACDVRSRTDLQRTADEVAARYGHLDVWVNNAGFGLLDSIEKASVEATRDLFATNLIAPIEAIQVVSAIMRKQRSGTIVNISSVAGHVALPYMGVYSASKHALNVVSKAARAELHGSGIHILNVAPGFVSTDFGKNAVKGADVRRPDSSFRRGITAERLARATVKAVERDKREIVVPWTNWAFVYLYRLAPGLVDVLVSRAMKPV
ncbi:MAG TPA: SDR family NAD(P)-dependent oxidoreductase [Terriglobales bacterium]